MNTYWLQKLIDVLRIQTNSENEKLMVLYLDKELKKLKLPYSIDAVGNIIVTKGKAKTYPCVVSHMDTVHSFVPDFEVYRDIDNEDILFALNNKQRVGIGGDDKCGVFACLYLLKTIPKIKVVFFSREESGCRGSMGINKSFFADCRYLIQLDRRGKRDFIQTYWSNKTISHDFSSEIGFVKRKYEYKNTIGTVTDVMKLWNSNVGISCINLSCGYYQPHTDCEYVSISDLWYSIKFTEEIINTMKSKKYTSLPPKPTVVTTSVVKGGYWQGRDQCCECLKWKKKTLLQEVQDSKTGEMICWPCKKEKYNKKALPVEHSMLPNGGIILFACHECGKRTDEMEAGDALKYRSNSDNHLYCNNCASILFTSQKEPIRCWICDRVIPKDHKVIERYDMRICEDCAHPSDNEVIGVC